MSRAHRFNSSRMSSRMSSRLIFTPEPLCLHRHAFTTMPALLWPALLWLALFDDRHGWCGSQIGPLPQLPLCSMIPRIPSRFGCLSCLFTQKLPLCKSSLLICIFISTTCYIYASLWRIFVDHFYKVFVACEQDSARPGDEDGRSPVTANDNCTAARNKHLVACIE